MNMNNYKLVIQYDGTRYQGWQKQNSGVNTIQGKLEAIFEELNGEPTSVHGAGRTDTGVHALHQVANVYVKQDLSEEEVLQYVNKYLPEDIAVTSVVKVIDRFHARLHAKKKVYQYCISNSSISNVFRRKYTYTISEKLDLKRMEEAANELVGTHDFKGFCSKSSSKKSTTRTIYSIEIQKQGDEIQITYIGNGFLYHMVRILTGTLIEVGQGKRDICTIQEILTEKNRQKAGELVPGKGLILLDVIY